MVLNYLEYALGWSLYSFRGRDAKLFIKGPAFADFPNPIIEITSPDCGPSNSTMKRDFTQYGQDRFPELAWSPPAAIEAEIKEYLLVSEDPDAPLPWPPTHGLFYAIPALVTRITADDVTLKDKKDMVLNGPFKASKSIRGTHYGGPKPPLGHGPHRYFYQLVALKEPLDKTKLSAMPTKKELADAIVDKMVGWGNWIGVYEKGWE